MTAGQMAAGISKKLTMALLACGIALGAASCRRHDPASEANILPATEASIIERAYRLNPGDELQVTVFQEQGLDQKVVVRPDGMISFPLAGHVRAAGLTTQEVEAELRQRLVRFVQNPQVNVSLAASQGYRIYVIGQVQRPGPYSAAQPVTVLQALSLAGGLTPFGSEDNIIIIRRVDDKQRIIRFNYARVKRGVDLDQNITLRSGDVVVVRD
jgi:polysaccharide export outer membrane protein